MTESIFLDLESPSLLQATPEQAGGELLLQFNGRVNEIGERYIKVHKPRVLYNNVKSVQLFQQAKVLYCLGLYESTIMVSRSTVEYIISEIWRNSVDTIKDEELNSFIFDSIDFRKMVQNLFDRKIIADEVRSQSNQLYDLGNTYIHPKSVTKEVGIDALTAITLLDNLIAALRNVLNEYDIIDGTRTTKKK